MSLGKQTLITAVIVSLVVWVVYFLQVVNNNPEVLASNYVTKTVSVDETTINVDIADTKSKRTLGLSGRTELNDRGMLFVFEEDGVHGIWMKDMYIPIDIIWINSSREIIHIVENVNPNTYPTVFKPFDLARFVLETDAGFVKENKISIGDIVEF